MQLGMPNWFSWYTKRDLYSREKLAADLETIRSFYMNQGYLDFKIDSVQVSIAPNKSDVYITINMTEGEKYTIAGAKLTGDLLGIDEELNKLLTLKAGEIYSAEQGNNVSTPLRPRRPIRSPIARTARSRSSTQSTPAAAPMFAA